VKAILLTICQNIEIPLTIAFSANEIFEPSQQFDVTFRSLFDIDVAHDQLESEQSAVCGICS
jgi:hypothetical protein